MFLPFAAMQGRKVWLKRSERRRRKVRGFVVALVSRTGRYLGGDASTHQNSSILALADCPYLVVALNLESTLRAPDADPPVAHTAHTPSTSRAAAIGVHRYGAGFFLAVPINLQGTNSTAMSRSQPGLFSRLLVKKKRGMRTVF